MSSSSSTGSGLQALAAAAATSKAKPTAQRVKASILKIHKHIGTQKLHNLAKLFYVIIPKSGKLTEHHVADAVISHCLLHDDTFDDIEKVYERGRQYYIREKRKNRSMMDKFDPDFLDGSDHESDVESCVQG